MATETIGRTARDNKQIEKKKKMWALLSSYEFGCPARLSIGIRQTELYKM